MDIALTELEQAINYWRALRPSAGEERALSVEVDMLATVYALMIYRHLVSMPMDSLAAPARQLIEAWHRQQRQASA